MWATSKEHWGMWAGEQVQQWEGLKSCSPFGRARDAMENCRLCSHKGVLGICFVSLGRLTARFSA